MVWAPPAFIVVLGVLGAIVAIMFLVMKISRWSHSGGEGGGMGDVSGYERRGALETLGQAVGLAREVQSLGAQAQGSAQEEIAEDRELALQNVVISREQNKAAILKRIRALSVLVEKYGLERVDKAYNQNAISVIYALLQKYYQILKDEVDKTNSLAKFETFKKNMETFKKNHSVLLEKIEAKEKGLAKHDKTDTSAMRARLPKAGKNIKGKLKAYINEIERLDNLAIKLSTKKSGYITTAKNMETDVTAAIGRVEAKTNQFKQNVLSIVQPVTAYMQVLYGRTLTPDNIMTYYRPVAKTSKTATMSLKNIFVEQKKELDKFENQLVQLEHIEKINTDVAKTVARKAEVRARFDTLMKGTNAANAERNNIRLARQDLTKATMDQNKVKAEKAKIRIQKKQAAQEQKGAEALGNLFGPT